MYVELWNIKLKEKTTKNNLSLKEEWALKNLQENEKIIIKESAKVVSLSSSIKHTIKPKSKKYWKIKPLTN